MESIDTELTWRIFGDSALGTLKAYWWVIAELRKGKVAAPRISEAEVSVKYTGLRRDETLAYVEWDTMVRAFVRRNSGRIEPVDDQSVWIVCLPPASAPSGWHAEYRALSVRVSCTYKELNRLETVLDLPAWPHHAFDREPSGATAEWRRERALAEQAVVREVPDTEPPTDVLCIAPWDLSPLAHRRCMRLAREIAKRLGREGGLAAVRAIADEARGRGKGGMSKEGTPPERSSATTKDDHAEADPDQTRD